jgi:hypothetical protein
MYVIAIHDIIDPATAFPRGQALMTGQGAPAGVRVLQFFPSGDAARVTCLWESPSVRDVQGYVDATLGDSSTNACYQVDSAQAFAERPLGLPTAPALAS